MNLKTSVSFPEPLLAKAQQRWKDAGHTSLSAYLQHLIRQDLESEVQRLAEQPAIYGQSENSAILEELRRISALLDQDTPTIRAASSASHPKPQRKRSGAAHRKAG